MQRTASANGEAICACREWGTLGGTLGSRDGSQLLGERQLPAVTCRLWQSQKMMHVSRRSTRCFGHEVVFPLLI